MRLAEANRRLEVALPLFQEVASAAEGRVRDLKAQTSRLRREQEQREQREQHQHHQQRQRQRQRQRQQQGRPAQGISATGRPYGRHQQFDRALGAERHSQVGGAGAMATATGRGADRSEALAAERSAQVGWDRQRRRAQAQRERDGRGGGFDILAQEDSDGDDESDGGWRRPRPRADLGRPSATGRGRAGHRGEQRGGVTDAGVSLGAAMAATRRAPKFASGMMRM